MAELQRFPLVTSTGQRGHIYRRARFIDPSEQSRVVLEDGTELIAASDAIEPRNDGTFLLHEQRAPETAPAIDSFDPAPPPPDARADHRTEPPSRIVDGVSSSGPLYTEDVGIDRVPVNQLVDEPPVTREEGDVTIIPVVEEVLVVQKRYMIKEEIRIQRQRHPVEQPRQIVWNGHGAEPLTRS